MSQKFIIKDVAIEGNNWLQLQKTTLDFLESRSKQVIKQEDILSFAFKRFLNEEVEKAFREFAKDYDKIYFAPVVVSEEKTVEKVNAKLKFYYEDNLEKYNLNQRLDSPFRTEFEKDPSISNFLNKFLNEYDFRIETSQPIDGKMSVRLSRINPTNSKKEYLNFETNDKRFEWLAKQVQGLKLGDKKVVSQDDQQIEVVVEKLWEYKRMEISDSNARLLQIPEVTDLASAQNYVLSTVTEQLFLREIVNYKHTIVEELIRKSPKLEIAEDFLDAEAKRQEKRFIEQFTQSMQDPSILKDAFENEGGELKRIARMQAEKDIELSFFDSLLARRLNIEIKNDEILKEERAIYSFIPPEQRIPENLNIPAIVNVLTSRKIGLYYLERNYPEIFKKHVKK